MSAARRRRRTSGSVGRGGGPGSGRGSALFSPEPEVLQEREGELAQEGVVVQPAPAPALKMVEPQLVLELLVQLLADPSSAARSIRCHRHGRQQPAEGAP